MKSHCPPQAFEDEEVVNIKTTGFFKGRECIVVAMKPFIFPPFDTMAKRTTLLTGDMPYNLDDRWDFSTDEHQDVTRQMCDMVLDGLQKAEIDFERYVDLLDDVLSVHDGLRMQKHKFFWHYTIEGLASIQKKKKKLKFPRKIKQLALDTLIRARKGGYKITDETGKKSAFSKLSERFKVFGLKVPASLIRTWYNNPRRNKLKIKNK